MPDPPASSVPAQVTSKLAGLSAGSAATVLVGAPASIVLRSCLVGSTPWVGSLSFTWSVAIGGLMSNVIKATLWIWAPLARPALALMV